MRPRSYAATLITLGLISAVSLVLANPASAHDKLLSSSPAYDARVAALPDAVTLTFEEPPVTGYTKVTLRDAKGNQLVQSVESTGSIVTATLDGSHARGAYLIRYSIMSDDGHAVAGTIPFTVATTATAAKPAAATTSRTSGSPSLVWLVAGIATLAVISIFATLRTTRRRRLTSSR